MSVSTTRIQESKDKNVSIKGHDGIIPDSGPWEKGESKALELLALEKVMPHIGTMREARWGRMTQQLFKEHPGVKDSDKLRLIFSRGMEIGKKDIGIKAAIYLDKINKYGEHVNALNDFWNWIHNKYEKSRERQQERLSTFIKESNIAANVSPVDALEEALWEHDFRWEDIENDVKIQNISLSVIRRDVDYVKVEELMERNPANWRSYLEQEWEKHAAPAYQRQMSYTRNWERMNKKGRHGRPLNFDF